MGVGVRCYYCNRAIRFDRKLRSPTGKFIPLNKDGTKHDCPNSPYKSQQDSRGDAA